MTCGRNQGEWVFRTPTLGSETSFGTFLSFTLTFFISTVFGKNYFFLPKVFPISILFVNHGQINILKTPRTHIYISFSFKKPLDTS